MIKGVPEVVKDLQDLLTSGKFPEGLLVINCTPSTAEVTKACQQLKPVFQEMGVSPVLSVETDAVPEIVAGILSLSLVFLSEALSHFTNEQPVTIRERFIAQAKDAIESMSKDEAEAFAKAKFGQ